MTAEGTENGRDHGEWREGAEKTSTAVASGRIWRSQAGHKGSFAALQICCPEDNSRIS